MPELDFFFDQDRYVVVIPPAVEEFGAIEVEDDLDELIVVAGNFTHWHAWSYEEELSENQKYLTISENVVEFIKDTVEDKVAFWGTHKTGGGFCYPEFNDSKREESKWFWSGLNEN